MRSPREKKGGDSRIELPLISRGSSSTATIDIHSDDDWSWWLASYADNQGFIFTLGLFTFAFGFVCRAIGKIDAHGDRNGALAYLSFAFFQSLGLTIMTLADLDVNAYGKPTNPDEHGYRTGCPPPGQTETLDLPC